MRDLRGLQNVADEFRDGFNRATQRSAELEDWIAREFAGWGVAMPPDMPSHKGEPFMSMAVAKNLAREAVAQFSVFAASPPAPAHPAQGEGERIEALWQALLDKDDRTSPDEYPDMALITFEEFRDAIQSAPASPASGARTDAATARADEREACELAVLRLKDQRIYGPSARAALDDAALVIRSRALAQPAQQETSDEERRS